VSTVYLALGNFLKARDHGDGEFVAQVGSSDFENLMTLNSVGPERCSSLVVRGMR
jgi:hypothetical protein